MEIPADTIITNAKVYTVDKENPIAEAVAIQGNKIVFVGSAEDVEPFIGSKTTFYDGYGRTVLPGFIDSHFHLMHGALGMGDIQCHEIDSLADLKMAVIQYARKNPDLPWLRGSGLRYGIVGKDKPLTRHHLDAIENKRPLVVVAYDVHTAWGNTLALEKAGLLHGIPDLPGGAAVIMGEDGLALGEVREAATKKLFAQIPDPNEARQRQLVKEALAWLASLGVTSVHNMDGTPEQAAFYAAMEDLDELTLRIYIPYDIKPETPLSALAEIAVPMREEFQSEMVRAGCVKFFMDGVYESYTAVSLNAYPNQPDNYGQPLFSSEHFAHMAAEADRLGLQIFVHACGDGAVRRVLDGYQFAQEQNGLRDSRHRVEHIEMIHPDDVPRFKELDVLASMQPLHAPLQENDTDVWIQRVREADWDRAFAWRTLRAAGATLAFGSDWPVASPNPFAGIAAALTRQPWQPGHNAHKQTLAEAIASYTKDAAYAEFAEDKKGQIKVGYLADLVLLSEDIFAVQPEEVRDVQVAMTFCNGRLVYIHHQEED